MRIFAVLLLTLFTTTAHAQGFSSPSGNIRCYVDLYETRFDAAPMVCLVFDADWDLPPDYGDDDPTCDLDRTRTVILPPDGPASARWTCHGDVFWPAPLGRISYGSEWSLASFICTSDTDGVRCVNGQGNSLWVRRASLVLN